MNLDDLLQVILFEPVEDDDVVHAVQKFGPEMRAQRVHDQPAAILARFFFGDELAPDVRRHDDDRVLEIDRPPLPIRDAAVIEHLQQHVENIVVRFLDFVEENDRIRPAPNRFGQLPAFFVADITRRRADQSRDRVLLHVFAHVDPDHGVLVVEQKFGERTRQFRFADAGRAEKNKRADRAIFILQTGAGATDGVRHGDDRFVLTNHALVTDAPRASSIFRARLPANAKPECASNSKRLRRCLLR